MTAGDRVAPQPRSDVQIAAQAMVGVGPVRNETTFAQAAVDALRAAGRLASDASADAGTAEAMQWDGTRASIDAMCRWLNDGPLPLDSDGEEPDEALLTYVYIGDDDVEDVQLAMRDEYVQVRPGDWIIRRSDNEPVLLRVSSPPAASSAAFHEDALRDALEGAARDPDKYGGRAPLAGAQAMFDVLVGKADAIRRSPSVEAFRASRVPSGTPGDPLTSDCVGYPPPPVPPLGAAASPGEARAETVTLPREVVEDALIALNELHERAPLIGDQDPRPALRAAIRGDS